MRSKIFMIFLFAFLGVSQNGSLVQAKIYDWIEPANTQIILLTDHMVDNAVRLAAVRRARYSIESSTFVQGLDPKIGLPLIRAFRDASQRGVAQKHIINRMGSMLGDPTNRASALLSDRRLNTPAEVLSWGFLGNFLRGINMTDKNHEKFMIIDGGTPSEVIFFGGRNNSNIDLGNLDMAFAIRPIVPGLPYLGDQLRAVYSDLWEDGGKLFPPRTRSRGSILTPPAFEEKLIQAPLETQRQRDEFRLIDEALAHAVDSAVASDPTLEGIEARPRKIRAITNDFLPNLLSGRYGLSFKAREGMTSDIHEVAAQVIERASYVDFSSMIVALPQRLKSALIEALRHRAEMHVRSNNRFSLATRAPLGIPFDLTLSEINQLREHDLNGNLRVHLLDRRLAKRQWKQYLRAVEFSHRKLLLTERDVMAGSDNGNETSRVRSGEIVFHAEDEEFAAMMRRLNESEESIYEDLTCELALVEGGRDNPFKRFFNRMGLSVY